MSATAGERRRTNALALAGRCECGVRLDLTLEEPDAHLICHGEKRCTRCELVKPLTEYHKGGSGHVGYCRQCEARINLRSYQKRYWSDAEFREAEKRRIKEYRCLGPKTGRRRKHYPIQQPLIRTCSACQETKPIAEFISGKGRYNRCRPCRKALNRERFLVKYHSDAEFKAKCQAKALAHWRKRHPKAA